MAVARKKAMKKRTAREAARKNASSARKPPRRPTRKSTSRRMKSSRRPTKKSVKKSPSKAAKKPGKRKTSRRKAAPKPLDINQLAQSIATLLKTQNVAPGIPLELALLRPIYNPASDADISAALQQLAGQQILAMRPDGSFVVAGPSPR